MSVNRFNDWQIGTTLVPVGPCFTCRHLFLDTPAGKPACRAFPDGIPEPILQGHFDHREPYVGDHGIVWEALPPESDWPITDTDWPGCEMCQHLDKRGNCKAYPNGIPPEILTHATDHLVARPGQRHGYLFKEKPVGTLPTVEV